MIKMIMLIMIIIIIIIMIMIIRVIIDILYSALSTFFHVIAGFTEEYTRPIKYII